MRVFRRMGGLFGLGWQEFEVCNLNAFGYPRLKSSFDEIVSNKRFHGLLSSVCNPFASISTSNHSR